MSQVTNVILTYTPTDEEPFPSAYLADLNREMGRLKIRGQFTRVDEHAGGMKAMELEVYLGAFNGLKEDNLVRAIAAVEWSRSDSLQLFIRRHAQDRVFELIVFA